MIANCSLEVVEMAKYYNTFGRTPILPYAFRSKSAKMREREASAVVVSV